MGDESLADVILAAFTAGIMATAKAEAKKAGKKVVKGTIEGGTNIIKSGVTGSPIKPRKGPKRKSSAYSRLYGRKFKELAKANKKKDGSWKKDGFKRTQKQAHAAARKERK